MSTPATVPIFAPDAKPGDLPKDIPYERIKEAVANGGKPAVLFERNGVQKYIPADQTANAVKAGAKILPIEDQYVKHPGFWSTLSDDLGDMAKSALPKSIKDVAAMVVPGVGQYQMGERFSEEDRARKAEGRSTAYRIAAPIAEGLTGVNARGMEESANEGDVGGVMGHAAAPVVATVATMGASEAAPAVGDLGGRAIEAVRDVTPKQAAQVVGGTSGAVAGHGPLSVPGAFYGAKGAGRLVESVLGKERANQPLIAPAKPFNAGAALPEAPDPALVQGNALSEGGKPAVDPSSGLGEIPVEQQIPGVNIRPSIERVMPEVSTPGPPAESPANRLPAAFQPLPAKAPPVPGTADFPFKSLSELPPQAVTQAIQELGPKASMVSLTTRANQIAKLAVEGAGGKLPEPLKPNVPLKDQGGAAVSQSSEAPVLSEPEGHTPVESSWIKSYKYDPETRTFEMQPKAGTAVKIGDVSPEEAKAFADADSQGKAWQKIKSNPLVAKWINGKWSAIKPAGR